MGPRQGHAGTGREEGERDEALDDALDDALDETDVDPTGNVVHHDASEAMEEAAQDTSPD